MRRALALILLFATVSGAQDLVPKAPAQSRPIAITGGTVHPVSGPAIEKGYVLFERGRVVEVGAGTKELGEGVDTYDATGKHVFPGFVSAYTSLGLVEIGAVRASTDTREVGELTPEVRAAVAVNPDSTLLPVTRSNGVLTFVTYPRGGAIPGFASIMSMDGWTWEDMAIRADAGLVVNWPNPDPPPRPERRRGRRRRNAPPERGTKRLDRIRDAFAAARAYIAAKKADPSTPTDVRWESTRPLFNGKRPVLFLANDYAQIVSAIDFAAKEKLKAVIVGGRDAPLCADLLKKHGVPVVIQGIHSFPRRNDSDVDEIYRLPARLEAAGILWCLASGERTANERNLPYTAGRAAAFGLSREAALASITLRAARVYGIDAELGSLEKGKRATLFVSDGDPLEITSNVAAAWVDGKRITLSNKQTALAAKYREKQRQSRERK
jgi:imidazolonepropionase-like amidohydrolase